MLHESYRLDHPLIVIEDGIHAGGSSECVCVFKGVYDVGTHGR